MPNGVTTYNPVLMSHSNLTKNYSIVHKTVLHNENFKLFNNIFIPVISDEDRDYLNSPITSEEVLTAIQSMSSNKSQGPDGFPPEFWPERSNIFIPALQASLDQGTIPETWKIAIICVILKDKDPEDCASCVYLIQTPKYSQKFWHVD